MDQQTTPPAAARFLAEAREALGPDIITDAQDLREAHAEDWSGYGGTVPFALARPRTTEELSALLAFCHARHQPVAVQGGLTGLCGGASVRPGELALSLERMSGIDSIDGGAIVCRAGTTVEAVQAAARDAGAELGIDFGARGSAMIGGAISTNAGGLHVIETGMTRAQVLGLEVVLADGRVLSELTAMVKVNAGFDLKHMFIGSEGALGVVSRACLALRPLRAGLATALLALTSPEVVREALTAARRAFGPDLSAFEAMWPDYTETMGARTPFGLPFTAPLTVILECRAATDEDASAAMERFLEASAEAGWLTDAVMAQSVSQARSLWALRDEGPALYNQVFADKVAFDISVPLAKITEAAEAMAEPLHGGDLFPLTYGHIGDQNLHFVVGADRPLGVDEKHSIEADVYRLVTDLGGSISAEHGIGIAKKPYLAMSRGPVALALMRDLKRTLDPRNILNPGRVFDL